MIPMPSIFRGTVFALWLAGACPRPAQDAATNAVPASSKVSAQTADIVAGMVQDAYPFQQD
jgi:hypothetical protein